MRPTLIFSSKSSAMSSLPKTLDRNAWSNTWGARVFVKTETFVKEGGKTVLNA